MAATMTRTDVHSPKHLVPEDYEFAYAWSGKSRATSERARQDWLDHAHPVEASQ